MPFGCVAEIASFELFEGVRLRVVAGEKAMMSFVEFEPHGVVPTHRHPHEQMGTVLEGEFELVIDGESRIVRVGDTWLIPSNVPHMARAVGTRAVALDVFSPPREEYVARALEANRRVFASVSDSPLDGTAES